MKISRLCCLHCATAKTKMDFGVSVGTEINIRGKMKALHQTLVGLIFTVLLDIFLNA